MAALPPCRAKAPEPKPMPSCKVLSSATACSHSPFGEIVLRSTPPPPSGDPKLSLSVKASGIATKSPLSLLPEQKLFSTCVRASRSLAGQAGQRFRMRGLLRTVADEVEGDKLALTTQTAMPRLPGEVHEPGNKDSWHSDDVDSMHPRAPEASHLPRRRMVFVLVHTWSALPLHCLRKPKMPSFCEQGMMMLWPGIG